VVWGIQLYNFQANREKEELGQENPTRNTVCTGLQNFLTHYSDYLDEIAMEFDNIFDYGTIEPHNFSSQSTQEVGRWEPGDKSYQISNMTTHFTKILQLIVDYEKSTSTLAHSALVSHPASAQIRAYLCSIEHVPPLSCDMKFEKKYQRILKTHKLSTKRGNFRVMTNG